MVDGFLRFSTGHVHYVNSNSPAILAYFPNVQIDTRQWHHVRIETVDQNIKVYVDGVFYLDVNDASHVQGQVVLEAGFCRAQFDNIVITDPSKPVNSIVDTFDVVDNDRPFGNQWWHTYGERLWKREDGSIVVERPTGQKDVFRPIAGGYQAPPLVYDTLVTNTGAIRYSLTTPSGEVRRFAEDGTLSSIADRNGNIITLGYSNVLATLRPFELATRALLVENIVDTGDFYTNALGRSSGCSDYVTLALVDGALWMTWGGNPTGYNPYRWSALDWASHDADLSAYTHLSVVTKGRDGGEVVNIELRTATTNYSRTPLTLTP